MKRLKPLGPRHSTAEVHQRASIWRTAEQVVMPRTTCVARASERSVGQMQRRDDKLRRTWWFGRHGEEASIPVRPNSRSTCYRLSHKHEKKVRIHGCCKRNCLSWHEFLDGAGGGAAHDPALSDMLWDIWEKEVVCAADVSVVPRMIESKWTRKIEVGLGVENTKEHEVGSVTASIQIAHSRCDDKVVNFWVVLSECETHGLHSIF